MDLDITSYLLGKNSSGGGTTINNQDITVTENGEYTADSGYTGLGTVTVNVPAPSGTINITENGTYDVTSKSSAVVNVPSGTPTTLSELASIGNTFQTNYLDTIPSDRTVYTNNSVTLYTPNSNYTKYMICKRDNGYRVIWIRGIGKYHYDPNDSTIWFEKVYNSSEKTNEHIFGVKYVDQTGCAYSDPYNIDELITKMQTPNGLSYRTYSAQPHLGIGGTEEDAVAYSNTVVLGDSLQFLNVGIISYNETIIVQS